MADPVLFKNAGVAFTTGTATGANFTVKAQVKSAEVPVSKAELADGVMGDTEDVVFPGLLSTPVSITYRQDYTASGVDQFFWGKFTADTAFRVQVAPVNATLTVTNPAYQLSKVRVHSITPISGTHGVLLENAVQLRPQSGCVLKRITASAS